MSEQENQGMPTQEITPADIRNFAKKYGIQIITVAILFRVLKVNKKLLKVNADGWKSFEMVVKNMDRNMLMTQEMIGQLREAGKTFTYYPGVGTYVD